MANQSHETDLSPETPAVKTDTLLDIDEVAAALHLHRDTIRSWIAGDSPIPFLKIGRRVFFRCSDLEAFLVADATDRPDILRAGSELGKAIKDLFADPSGFAEWGIKIQTRVLWRAACETLGRRLRKCLIRKTDGRKDGHK